MSSSPSNTYITNFDGKDIKSYFGNLSLSNQYQVNISGLSAQLTGHLGAYYGVNTFSDIGLYCTDANLPTSSFATAEVKDNFMGVTQEFAHTRLYTDLDFTFYVERDYNNLRFFEGWMDFISGGNRGGEPAANSISDGNIYRRFNYPKYYKTSGLYIIKFERDSLSSLKSRGTEYNYRLKYQFINAFPKSLTTTPVSYGAAEILKVTVSFNFDRYITERAENIDVFPSSSEFAAAAEEVRNQTVRSSQATASQVSTPGGARLANRQQFEENRRLFSDYDTYENYLLGETPAVPARGISPTERRQGVRRGGGSL